MGLVVGKVGQDRIFALLLRKFVELAEAFFQGLQLCWGAGLQTGDGITTPFNQHSVDFGCARCAALDCHIHTDLRYGFQASIAVLLRWFPSAHDRLMGKGRTSTQEGLKKTGMPPVEDVLVSAMTGTQ